MFGANKQWRDLMARREVAGNSSQRSDLTDPRVSAAPNDPKVVQFLNDFSELQRQRDHLMSVVDNRDREVAHLNDRVVLLQNDLDRAQTSRDEFQRGYFELKAQLSILSSTAIAACQQISTTANNALETTKAAMLEKGIAESTNPDGSPKLLDVDTEMASLAAINKAMDGRD